MNRKEQLGLVSNRSIKALRFGFVAEFVQDLEHRCHEIRRPQARIEIGNAPGRLGTKIEIECLVDRNQRRSKKRRLCHGDHATDMCTAMDHPLPHAHHFDPPSDIDTELAWTVFTVDCANTRVEPQASERSLDPVRDVFEAGTNMKSRIGVGRGPGKSDRLFEKERGLATRQPNHGWNARLLGQRKGTRIARSSRIETRKEHSPIGGVETQAFPDRSDRHTPQHRMGNRGIEERFAGELVAMKMQRTRSPRDGRSVDLHLEARLASRDVEFEFRVRDDGRQASTFTSMLVATTERSQFVGCFDATCLARISIDTAREHAGIDEYDDT